MTIITWKCDHCASEDVRRDAWAEWSIENQCWELGAVFDDEHCEACGGETTISEHPAEIARQLEAVSA